MAETIQLEGSCHCRAVSFTVQSEHVFPYQYCYCSICRKTQGGGGYAINLSADHRTLKVKGKRHVRRYNPIVRNPEDERGQRSSGERAFCAKCASALWLYDPEWPELVHPFASAIDTPLPVAPEHTHLMLEFKAPWVELHASARDQKYQRYPEESIAEWHERLGLVGKQRASRRRAA